MGRLGAIVAGLVALTGVVMGGRALVRARAGAGDERRRGFGATLAGLFAIALGGVVAASSDGTIGTGNGLGGAIVAMVLGLIGSILGGLVLARSRKRG